MGVREVYADIGRVDCDRHTTTYGDITDAVMRDGAPARDDSVPAGAIDARSAAGYVMWPAASSYHSACVAISDDNHEPIRSMAIEQLSKLNYVDVNVHGIPGVHTALHDTGSEINLINRDFVERLSNLPAIGRIRIKGVIGPAVETDLTLLDISPAASEAGYINIAPPLREVFAICDGLNENVIVTADTVRRLATVGNYESLVATTVVKDSATTVEENTDFISTSHNIETTTDAIDSEALVDTVSHDEQTGTDFHVETDLTSADTKTLVEEEAADSMLQKYFDMARNGNKHFFVRDGILYHRGKVNGNKVEQLCLPQKRIETVLRIAHDLPSSGHQAIRRTNDPISLSFFFPGLLQRVKEYCNSCAICQIRARERRTDLLPIKPIDRHEDAFGHLQADIIGPMGDGVYKYALVLTDIQTRYVTAYELTATTAKNIVDKLIIHSSYFGLPRFISFDNATYFTSELTKVCLERLGVSPRFHCPYNPRGAGLVERSNGTLFA